MIDGLPRRERLPRRRRFSEMITLLDERKEEVVEMDVVGRNVTKAKSGGEGESEELAGGRGYEFGDHPADVIVHAWGRDMGDAFGACAIGVFAYMTDLGKVEEDDRFTKRVQADGSGDLRSALEGFLDSCLMRFMIDGIVLKRVTDVRIEACDGGEKGTWTVSAHTTGEKFQRSKHSQVCTVLFPCLSFRGAGSGWGLVLTYA